MANPIILKRSAVPAKEPLTTDLQLGELAMNTYDGRVFFKKNNGTESIDELVPVSALGSGAFVRISVSSTAPGSPSFGDLWVDTSLL